jgi:steroid delta-isomerase-like uncharacterized protein
MTDRNKQLVHRFVEVVNTRDYDALEAFVAPDFVRHCPATPDVVVRSRDDLRRFLEQDLETFPDSVVTLEKLIAEGDFVGFWATYSATQTGQMGPFPPSGRRVTGPFAGYFRIEDGMLRELFVTWDNVDMLTQLGHFGDEDAGT